MFEVLTKIILPPKYYLAHFLELKSALFKQYSSFFEDSHHNFFSEFDSLSEDAQCLYLRLINRKGRFFHIDTLNYEEINSFESALSELMHRGFARNLETSDWNELLDVMPKGKLAELAVSQNLQIKKSWPREKIREVISTTEFQNLPDYIVQGKIEELSYILFLFFGKIQDNLALYTLRDLGVRKVSKQKETYQTRFETKEEALSNYF